MLFSPHFWLHWLHLLVVVSTLGLLSLVQGAAFYAYRLFPFPSLLDAAYLHSTWLRRVFRFRLGGATAATPRALRTAPELIRIAGFRCEQHTVLTDDGFVLGLHRIVCDEDSAHGDFGLGSAFDTSADASASLEARLNLEPGGRSSRRTSPAARSRRRSVPAVEDLCASPSLSAAAPPRKLPMSPRPPVRIDSAALASSRTNGGRPPVLLWHGLMMSSDAWLALGRDFALPFVLADAGFDVWLGNSRGNRYSQLHTRLSPDDASFWSFSLDELARFDVPAAVDYVLARTRRRALAYVGFSQGSAQMFAALAHTPALNDKICAFAALSPAMAVRPLQDSAFATLVTTDPTFLYRVFGTRRMIPVALDIQRSLSTTAWVRLLDASMAFLFGWSCSEIAPLAKLKAYQFLYSITSVRLVVEWMSIVSAGRFAMATPERAAATSSAAAAALPFLSGRGAERRHRVLPLYDTTTITTPLALFVGGRDTLIDVPRLLRALPRLSGPIAVRPDRSGQQLFQPGPGRSVAIVAAPNSPQPQLPASLLGSGSSSSQLLALTLPLRSRSGAAASLSEQLDHSSTSSRSAAPASPLRSTDAAVVFERHAPLVFEEPEYEHLDTIWGRTAALRLFPAVVTFLRKFSDTHNGFEAEGQALPSTGRRARSPSF